MRKAFFLFLIFLFLVSCGRTTYLEEDFYDSVWEHSEGSKVSTIELHKDGTCDVNNFDWDTVYPESRISRSNKNDRPESYQGYWSIGYDLNGCQCIDFSIKLGESMIGFSLYIIDMRTLRTYIGDPDLCDYYDLKRTNVNTSGTINDHEWVDMGTSVKWATTNVGSTDPKDNGDYFAWGEVNPAPGGEYTRSNCQLYGDSSIVSIAGEVEYDAARANWGATWRLPTRAEWRELIKDCEWKWYGSGYKVTAKNGNVIYLPAAGSRESPLQGYVDKGWKGYYWSASPGHLPQEAWSLYFNSQHEVMYTYGRTLGCSVRPVTE